MESTGTCTSAVILVALNEGCMGRIMHKEWAAQTICIRKHWERKRGVGSGLSIITAHILPP